MTLSNALRLPGVLLVRAPLGILGLFLLGLGDVILLIADKAPGLDR